MKNNRIRYLTVIIILVIGIILIRNNVTATKETTKNTGDISVMSLEISSELVQKTFSKLTLLDQTLVDDKHEDIYFVGYEDKKEISNDEKIFIVLENLYSSGSFEITSEENIDYVTFPLSVIKERFAYLFQEEDFDIKTFNYDVAEECGITELNYTDEDVQVKINKCERDKVNKYKIENATKKGDYLYLDIKAYEATKMVDKNGKNIVRITNFNEKKVLEDVEEDEFMSDEEKYFRELAINAFRFTFLLKGDDYYLINIKRG